MKTSLLTRGLTLIASLLLSATVFAQNLVTNGDFEQRNAAPEAGGAAGRVNIGPTDSNHPYDDLAYWNRTATVNSSISSAYYIASDGQPDVNTSNFGFTAHNSKSCIVIGRHDAQGDKSHDDFVTQRLLQPLLNGHRYHVEFWALRFGSSQFHNKLAISITSGDPTFDGAQNSLTPAPGSKVLVSPDIQQYYTWVQVTGDITIPASDSGNNRWLTIGNDRSDQTYDSSLPSNGLSGLAYAIDDVSLVEIPCATPAYPAAYQYDMEGDNCVNTAHFQINNYDPSLTYTFTRGQNCGGILRYNNTAAFIVKTSGYTSSAVAYFTITTTNSCGASATSDTFEANYNCDEPSAARASSTTAYPNPASESITMPEGTEGATLVNDQGRVLQTTDKSAKLDVQSLPDGLYNLQMMQDGKLINQRIQIKH